MALAKIQKTIFKVDSNTLPAAGHTYSIQVSGGGSAIPIYSNSSGTVPLDNPGTLPANGLLSFFIRSGTCRIKVTDPSTLEEQIWDNEPCISPDVLSSAKATLQFSTLADLINCNPINKGETIDPADYVGQKVSTVVNSTTSKKGGAKYIIKTAAQVTADGDVIDDQFRNFYLLGGTDLCAIKVGSRHSAYSLGMLSGPTHNNTLAFAHLCQNVKNGEQIDFEGGEFRIFDGISGIPTSGADPVADRAVPLSQLPIIEGKKRVKFKNGLVYVANQSTTVTKSYFPCTLTIKSCEDITFDEFSLESKGESYGDADASFPLTKPQRADFLPYNSGVALLIALSKNVTVKNGNYRLCGSVSAVYVSSSSGVKLDNCFANCASLGYAAYAVDAWLGDTSVSGFRSHDTQITDCKTHRETLTTRDTAVSVGSSTYASKGGAIAEDPSVKLVVKGGYYADAYPNGSSRDIGNAFSANACTVVVSGSIVENCASVGFTGQSVDVASRLIVSDVEARGIRKTLHQVQQTSFGTQEFSYSNCTAEINNSGIWPGDGDRAREYSSVIANMKQATTVKAKLVNCTITGPECIWVNDTACYGSLLIDNCEIETNGFLSLSNGWGGASRDYRRGIKIKDSTIRDVSSETSPYMSYANFDGTAFTYINIDFSSSTLDCSTVRDAYGITISGSNLVTNLSGFNEMLGAWSSNSYLENGVYTISYKEQRGLSGANRRVVFEYPNRVAFKPYVVNDATSAGANDVFLVLSAVGAAVINADGNVEQEFFINDTGLTLWSVDSRMPAQYVNSYPPLL